MSKTLNLYWLPQGIQILISESHDKICHVISLMLPNRTVYSFEGPTIVYCRKKSDTEDVCRSIKSNHVINCNHLCYVWVVGFGVSCDIYHAGLSNTRRENVHNRFLRDELQVTLHVLICYKPLAGLTLGNFLPGGSDFASIFWAKHVLSILYATCCLCMACLRTHLFFERTLYHIWFHV